MAGPVLVDSPLSTCVRLPAAEPSAAKRWTYTWSLTSQATTTRPLASIATAGFCSEPASLLLARRSTASIAEPLAAKRRSQMPWLSPVPAPCQATTKAPVDALIAITGLVCRFEALALARTSPDSGVPLAAKRRNITSPLFCAASAQVTTKLPAASDTTLAWL